MKKIILLVVIVFVTLSGNAQQTAQKFIQETQYLLYLPDGYKNDTTTQWPLMLFLHGSGESGVDLEKIKVHGPPKLIEVGKKFPFIIISPQAPPQTGWRAEILKGLLDDIKKKYRVDNDRVYLTGLSMGGFGTWDLAEKYPDDFAAIAPICGGGDTSKIWKLRHMPVWCFHGAKDDIVPLAASQRMVNALKAYNPHVKFTIYPEANHNSWEVTYNNDSLYTWLLSQKKFTQTAIAVDEKLLKVYEGIYVSANSDSLRLVVENGRLIAKPRNGSIELKPSSDSDFFWNERSVEELHFVRDNKKVIKGFIVFSGEKEELKKVGNLPSKK